MRKFVSFTALIAMLFMGAAAHADGVVSDWGVAPKVSTLGLGLEFSKSVPVLNLTGRLGYNMFTYEHDDDINDIDYDLDLELQSVSALVDWRPFGALTHLTGGMLLNMNEVSAVAMAADDYNIGGITYTPDEVGNLTGRVEFDDFAPYLGVGWNLPLAPGFAMSLDLGVVFQGTPQVSLGADGTLADDPLFQDALAQEEADFQDDVEDYEYYPVVSLGIRKSF